MNKDNLICDMETGICGVPGEANATGFQMLDFSKPQEKADLYYVTDPICSHCWAIEPQFRAFTERYREHLNVHIVMGGLLENWDGFADRANGISGPEDVAPHWREVGEQSRMPIDGSLWHTDPVTSSFIPSRVFKVVQKHDPSLAPAFLRRAREELFAFNRNISGTAVLKEITDGLGLDGDAIVKEAGTPEAQQLLEEDFRTAARLGARRLPTIVLANSNQQSVKIAGARPLEAYEEALKQVLTEGKPVAADPPNLQSVLGKEKRLFSKEIEVLYGISREEVASFVARAFPDGSFETENILGETLYMLK
ncbi:DsbA family protein [Bhargavaea beijingensis]|uniref:DsbA family protein n=1 Tax=Bhargavaea beijingensis TaxID=426756 RepID=A0A1G6Y6T0_9BACL|nr:DsbA family protein [Bhargavaea beijingensis]MCW1927829.1 DsbA family protein [Bhargavaea beijingensis]RSK31924.1 DsbA family protein [Bhargavaea beijingensis]SDD85982.1 Predicted dithiol-disulfide isomerase, DsbA family [Bhargavaea beijingensis]